MVTAVCVFSAGTSLTVAGILTFLQETPAGTTSLTGTVTGLTPGSHGLSIYEFGDFSSRCLSFGSRFDPFGSNKQTRPLGQLGNIVAGDDGKANVHITNAQIPLSGENSVIGRGLVVHEKADDLGQGGDEESLKTGNAGPRLACGVIGLAKSTK
ncbi:superoxide dismutase [Cu-Zn] [Plakobranchus ocellatus]|uniref:Superoxide dismutase [Cu-Zn] n=1 Tax=Plakobranchus ocellatus TaxID=259542 RepID=A0AAV4CZ94_9GAST|nr:superoxide dismutase [Cu-Zn] [Plakobranchus ocellatus]